MKTQYFDSHAHLTSDAIFPEIEPVLQRAQKAGVSRIVNICTDPATLQRGLALQKDHPWILNAAATTPHDVDAEGEEVFPIIEKEAKAGRLAAVGETGLDYHYNHSAPDTQKAFLIRYLHLAMECSLPVIIHCREAFSDFFEIIDREYRDRPGILHCFTGTVEEAQELVRRNWTVSFSGIVTFKKSEELRQAAKIVPLDQCLIETDTPYLAPQKWRGKRNEPAYITETASMIADVKGISPDEVAEATFRNGEKFFNKPLNLIK